MYATRPGGSETANCSLRERVRFSVPTAVNVVHGWSKSILVLRGS